LCSRRSTRIRELIGDVTIDYDKEEHYYRPGQIYIAHTEGEHDKEIS
jgi:hypothetical protein